VVICQSSRYLRNFRTAYYAELFTAYEHVSHLFREAQNSHENVGIQIPFLHAHITSAPIFLSGKSGCTSTAVFCSTSVYRASLYIAAVGSRPEAVGADPLRPDMEPHRAPVGTEAIIRRAEGEIRSVEAIGAAARRDSRDAPRASAPRNEITRMLTEAEASRSVRICFRAADAAGRKKFNRPLRHKIRSSRLLGYDQLAAGLLLPI